ncbi:MAG: lysine--tRNA ligase, partial [Clostridiaceae bacterium]|nr:lysine--tRNA ligase [Clostridiaceae bacterium]
MAGQKGQEQDLNQLLKVRRDKLADLQAAGKDPFQITKYNQTHHSAEVKELYNAHEAKILAGRAPLNTEGMDEAQAKEALNADYNERRAIMDARPIHISIAGRMMFKRVMGKASFCNIRDLQGTIQVYVARDAIGEESYADFKKSDIGDIYGVEGYAFRTKTGEVSVHAEKMTLLSKSLQILPEKYHGITDTDMRYRQRYVDLIMNEDVKNTFIKRSQIIKEIRTFLAGRNFMEVETPTLVSNAGGAAARPFETHYNALNEDVKLRISLELYLKRLIVGGLERVFEIGRVYRNEGVDTRHNPEFTLMELYQAYTDYEGMMELTESMFRYLAEKVCGSTKFTYNGIEIDFGKPFERLTMNDAIKKYAGIDFDAVETDEEAKRLADERHIEYEERHTKGDIINLFFEEYCEKELIQPTFIMDHPLSISPLTKKKPSDPNKVERFELFINTWEMCNAYSELNDPIDQRERFAQQDANAEAGDDEAQHTDEDFLNALEIGMPPTGGIGYGIDRLVMLLTDSPAIRDVLLFPTMKSLDSDKKASKTSEAAPAESVPTTSVSAESVQLDLSKVKIEPLFEEFVDFDTFAKSDFRVVKIEACEAVPKSKKLLKFTLNDGTDKKRTILSGIHEYY